MGQVRSLSLAMPGMHHFYPTDSSHWGPSWNPSAGSIHLPCPIPHPKVRPTHFSVSPGSGMEDTPTSRTS